MISAILVTLHQRLAMAETLLAEAEAEAPEGRYPRFIAGRVEGLREAISVIEKVRGPS